jgi:predicted TIM-barrel fold metal-dependent hydrolase
MIIDFHTHVFPPRIKRDRDRYIARDPCFALLYSNKKAHLATSEDLIASMDRAGVDISVVLNIGWTTHDLCVETNDYILESIARYPGRLVGFCTVQPQSIEAAAEIGRCARGGARGIGEIRPDAQLFDLGDEAIMTPLVGILQKHRLALLIHASEPVGHDYPGKGKVTPGTLYPFLARYPELTVICSHWGGGLPFYALMPEVEQAIRNVYFDTAASPFLYRPRIYEVASQLVGIGKILFGSDYPLLPPTRLLEEINSTSLSDDEKSSILSGNARRLLGI